MSLLACTTKHDLNETVHVRLSHTHMHVHTHTHTSYSSSFMHVPLLFLHYHQQSKLYAQECASSENGQESYSISSNSHLLSLLSWALYFSCNSFFLCVSHPPHQPQALGFLLGVLSKQRHMLKLYTSGGIYVVIMPTYY